MRATGLTAWLHARSPSAVFQPAGSWSAACIRGWLVVRFPKGVARVREEGDKFFVRMASASDELLYEVYTPRSGLRALLRAAGCPL